MAAAKKVILMMADHGQDPTETAVPYTAFKAAGFHVQFATENGSSPRCDTKLLEGITQKLLGANQQTLKQHHAMTQAEEWLHPLSWTAAGFSLDEFDLVFFPGGHEKSVRQIIDSPIVHKLVADYFPKTRKPSGKAVGAICHGVMVLSSAKLKGGKSVIHECTTTALPARFEQVAFWGTRLFLGDYYKTYGAGSEDVEVSVRNALDNPSQFKKSLGMSPFVVEDEKYNYLSARFPADANLLAEKLVALLQGTS